MTAPLSGGLAVGGSGVLKGKPSYAGANNTGVYEQWASRYNLKASNKYQTRLAIANAAAQLGIWDCAFLDASLALGYNGVGLTQDTSKSWPMKLRARLAAMFGGVPQYDGTVPFSGQDDRTTLNGTATRVSAPAFVFSSGAGGSVTTGLVGTDIWVTIYDGSTGTGAQFTVQVDALAPVNVVPAGGNTQQTIHVATGLANVAHTVTVVCTAGNNLWTAASATGQPFGFRFSDLALGGTSTSFGTQYTNWTNVATPSSLQPSRFKAMADAGIVPHTWFIGGQIGNDAFHSVPPASVNAGLDSIEALIPNAPNGQRPDIFYTLGWQVTPVSAATWATYEQMLYTRVDSLNRPIWDWNDAMGGLIQGINYGAIGPDLIHPTYANQEAYADSVSQALLV